MPNDAVWCPRGSQSSYLWIFSLILSLVLITVSAKFCRVVIFLVSLVVSISTSKWSTYFTMSEEYYKAYFVVIQQLMASLKIWNLILAFACFNITGWWCVKCVNPYPMAFLYGNGMVLHFYKQQESSTTKTVHKVINKGLKAYV